MTDPKEITLAPKLNPLIASLPAHLKDPANYQKIRKVIMEALAGNCSHSEMIEWASCTDCQSRMTKRRDVLRHLGFKNPRQYLAWQKIHEEIKARYPLVDWKATKPTI